MIICTDCGVSKSEHEMALITPTGSGQCISCQKTERHDNGHHQKRADSECTICKQESLKSKPNQIWARQVLKAIEEGSKKVPK